MKEYYRVKAYINLDAIYDNIVNTRKIIHKETKIMIIIKADGYGHGALPIAKTLDSVADAYGVAIIQEGVEMRKEGIKKPILILGFTPKEYYEDVVQYDISQTVFQYDMAKALSDEAVKQGEKAGIHIKIDTGMSRIGFSDTKESIGNIKKIAMLPNIIIEGIYTHFSCADEKEREVTYRQLEKFNAFVKELEGEGIYIPIKHASNSAGIMEFPEANLNMVRSGISTYGLYPSPFVDRTKLKLEPGLELKTAVVYVKEIEEGIGVSYGSTFVTTRKTKVATIPVGYADGYPRNLSSKGRVLIRGKSAPIIGRICMDQFMVDVTEIHSVEEGDTVTLIGRDGNEFIPVEEMADLAGSFNYEFICGLSKRIPREYYRNGKKVGAMDFYDCTRDTLEFPM